MAPTVHASASSLESSEHRVARVRSLWADIQARDWAAMRAAFADCAVMHWPVTGERFDGPHIVALTEHWAQAEEPPAWRRLARLGTR